MKISSITVQKTDKIQTIEQLCDSPDYTFELLPMLRNLALIVLEIHECDTTFIIIVTEIF